MNEKETNDMNVVCEREMLNSYKILVGNPESMRPLRRPRHGCKRDAEMELNVAEEESTDSIYLAYD
jgi:hypothetical protein